MPPSFLAYATDGDGDGRADIWRSEADTVASIASYLARHGWAAGRDWGFEVTVPSDVSCTLEGPDQGRTIAAWEPLGIARVSGRPFPEHERRGEGYLLMPAGRKGPTFIELLRAESMAWSPRRQPPPFRVGLMPGDYANPKTPPRSRQHPSRFPHLCRG